MKSKLMSLVYILIYILGIYILFNTSENIYINLIIIFSSLLNIYILNKIFKNVLDKTLNISNKHDKYILVVTNLLYIILGLVISSKTNILTLFLNLFAIVVNNYLAYKYARRKVNKQSGYCALFINIFINLLIIFTRIDYCLLSTFVLPIIMLYIMEGFDYTSPFRKKNLFRVMIIVICSMLLAMFNKVGLVVLIGLLFEVYRKGKAKCLLLLSFSNLIAIFVIISLVFILDINIYHSISVMHIDYYITSIMIMILSFIAFFDRNSIKQDKNFNCKIIISVLLTILVNMFLSIDLIDYAFIYSIIVVFIAINIYNFKFGFSLSKYILPKEIKKISVVIPNYNYANYIEERIDSILKQNYPIYELIILDDCSSDNSEEVILRKIEKIKVKCPNLTIKYIPNQINSGNVFKQWLKAFDVYTGDYLWIAEADDLCSKYFLNSVMKGFDDDKVVVSYAESNAIDENGKEFKKDLRDWIDIYNTGRWNNDYIVSGIDELKKVMCINNTIANVSSIVFKRNSKIDYKKYLKTAQKYTLAGDWYFYSKVLLHGKIAYDSNSYNYHRIHRNSVTTTTDNFIHYKEIVSIQDSIIKDVNIPKPILNRIEERRANLRRQLCISNDELKYDKISLDKLIKDKNINDEVLLSIIVPVYNVEEYINKCLKSVFKDLPIKTEVIVINDGSPDNSEEIIMDYAKKYPQLKYYKKKNGGLSSVKNMGLKLAKGRYIIYLDSDDYVSSNMYSTMLKKIINEDADIVYSDVLMTFEDGHVQYVSMCNYDRKDNLMRILDGSLMAASWNKMVKRELYSGLEFPEELNNEDVAISPILFLRSNKMLHIPSPFYKYVQRSGSIQNSGFNEKRFMIFDTAKMCFERIKDSDYISQDKIIGSILTHQILAILIYLISEVKNKQERIYYIDLFCKKFNALYIDYENNQYVREYMKKYDMQDVLLYIKEKNISKIDRCIRRR